MDRDGPTSLAAELRQPPPEGIAKLADEHLQHLAGALRSARLRQAEALDAAGENAFGYVPRLLRGPIRRMLRS